MPLPPFTDWLCQKLGTRKWFVHARWSARTRERYEVRLSHKQYRAAMAEWEALR